MEHISHSVNQTAKRTMFMSYPITILVSSSRYHSRFKHAYQIFHLTKRYSINQHLIIKKHYEGLGTNTNTPQLQIQTTSHKIERGKSFGLTHPMSTNIIKSLNLKQEYGES